jgi:hypothetical protein
MATVTTNHQTFDITEATPERLELVRKAQEADIAEHGLTIKQALKRYKKAVAWAFALSLCLVMDGYDVSLSRILEEEAKTRSSSLLHSTVKHNFNIDSVSPMVTADSQYLQPGSRVSPILQSSVNYSV